MIKENDINAQFIKSLKEITYKMNLLLVEDDLQIQSQLKSFLSNFFKNINTANDGIEALEKYKNNQYSLVITDLSMPNMTGDELIENIKRINESQYIIVISAHSEQQRVIKLANAGISGYLVKPIDLSATIQQIYKACKVLYNQTMLEHFTLMLEESNSELLIQNSKLQEKLKENTKPKEEEKPLSTYTPTVPSQSTTVTQPIIQHKRTMSAAEFLETYPLELDETNENLENLEAKFYTLLASAEKNFDSDVLSELISLLNNFAREIELIPNFGQIADGIYEVAKAFDSVEDFSKMKAILPMLGSLFDNLEKWRREVFVYSNVEDIHYMDNSLLSDAQSLQNFLNSNNTAASSNDEDLFEFF